MHFCIYTRIYIHICIVMQNRVCIDLYNKQYSRHSLLEFATFDITVSAKDLLLPPHRICIAISSVYSAHTQKHIHTNTHTHIHTNTRTHARTQKYIYTHKAQTQTYKNPHTYNNIFVSYTI